TFAVQIALRNSDRSSRFENKIIFFLHVIGLETVSDPARDHDVIFRAIPLLTENGLDRPTAFEDENDFVGAAVFIILELSVFLLGAAAPRGHVLIEENRHAATIEIAATGEVRRAQMMMPQRAVGRFLQLLAFEELDTAHPRGRTQVVHDRVGFVETFRCNDMLVGDAFVLISRRGAVAMKPDMMLPWNLSEPLIKWHVFLPYKFPRRSCSFSSASNRALKFPLPKLFAPLRWMISKNNVGRSST